MKFKFNTKNLIPNLNDYVKILLSAFFVIYIFEGTLLSIFPLIGELPKFWNIVFWVIVVTYFKGLFDVKLNGRDYF